MSSKNWGCGGVAVADEKKIFDTKARRVNRR